MYVHPSTRQDIWHYMVWSTLQEHPTSRQRMRHSAAAECTTSSSGEAYIRFFRMRPAWVCEMASMTCISTALSDIRRRVQRLNPSGGVPHAIAMILASMSPVHLAGTGGVSRFLRLMPFHGSSASESDRSRKFSFMPCTA